MRWWDGDSWTRHRQGPAGERRKRWPQWVTVVAVVIAMGTVAVASMVLYATASGEAHDIFSLDDERIWAAAASGCSKVAGALDAGSASRQEAILAGNEAIGDLINGMEAVGHDRLASDPPALDWIEDWRHLAAERAAFAAALADDPGATFPVPQTDDGHPISGRMADVAPPECGAAVERAAAP